VLTLQSLIVIAVGWSAIYWQWTSTHLAVLIGFKRIISVHSTAPKTASGR
jgi:hypothetical protein